MNKKYFSALAAVITASGMVSCGMSEYNPQNDWIVPQATTSADSATSSAETETATTQTETTTAASETDVTETSALAESETTETTTTEPEPEYFFRGNIVDTNGNTLVSSVQDNSGNYRYINDDYAYPLSNILCDNSDGLDSAFSEILRTENPTPTDLDNSIGRSVQITIDADMQKRIYNYMASENVVGSVVVMRTDGSVASEVSYPSYNDNLFRTGEMLDGSCRNHCLEQATPGSTFKIASEILADYHGITELYDDGIWTADGAVIHNWDCGNGLGYGYPVENRSLYSAFINSSNVFFAKVFDTLGQDMVEQNLADVFCFSDYIPINCDFGTLYNTLNIDYLDRLRRSGFGQGNVRMTPMYLAMLTREAIFGDMVRPFTLQNVIDTNDYSDIISDGSKRYDVIASLPTTLYDDSETYVDCKADIREAMLGVASNLNAYAPDGYTLYAKTGTAEVGAGDYHYITGCMMHYNDNTYDMPFYDSYSGYDSNGSYIITLQVQNPEQHNFQFAKDDAYIYGNIMNLVLGYY